MSNKCGGPSGLTPPEASESGESGEFGGTNARNATNADKLVAAITKLLGRPNLSSKDHLRAAVLLERLQNELHFVKAGAAVKLSFLLMKMMRCKNSSGEKDVHEQGFFGDSMVLIFIIIAAIHARETGEVEWYDAHTLAAREMHLAELETQSIWSQLCRPMSRKRSREVADGSVNGDDDGGFSDVHSINSFNSVNPLNLTKGGKGGKGGNGGNGGNGGKERANDANDANGAKGGNSGNYNFSASKDVEDLNSKMEQERDDAEKLVMRPMLVETSSSRWNEVLYNGRDVASTVVGIAAARLQSLSSLSNLEDLAMKYARTMLEQSRSTLLTASRSNFMSLKVSSLMMLGNSGITDAVGSLVASSASESAQVTYRDLLLSFLLPRDFVGVRRTLLLPRHVSTRATKDYSTYVSLAHESAIVGLVDAHESTSELKRMCALLTSIAMLTTGDDIRQDDAFGGRVLLPFIECPEPKKKGCLQLFVDVSQRQFTVFKAAGGKVHIELSGSGVETLETALVLIADDR